MSQTEFEFYIPAINQNTWLLRFLYKKIVCTFVRLVESCGRSGGGVGKNKKIKNDGTKNRMEKKKKKKKKKTN